MLLLTNIINPGGIPAVASASGGATGVEGEVKEEQSDDFLTDLLAQLDPPPDMPI